MASFVAGDPMLSNLIKQTTWRSKIKRDSIVSLANHRRGSCGLKCHEGEETLTMLNDLLREQIKIMMLKATNKNKKMSNYEKNLMKSRYRQFRHVLALSHCYRDDSRDSTS